MSLLNLRTSRWNLTTMVRTKLQLTMVRNSLLLMLVILKYLLYLHNFIWEIFYWFSRLKKSLWSISHLIADNKVFVEFHSNVCLVKDKENHQVLLQGKLEDGLYKLHIPKIKSHAKSVVNSFVNPSVNPIVGLNLVEWKRRVDAQCHLSSISVSPDVLHKRLGHPSSRVMSHVQESCNSNASINGKLNFCDAFQFGKIHTLPYNSFFSQTFFTSCADPHRYMGPCSNCFKLRIQILHMFQRWFF